MSLTKTIYKKIDEILPKFYKQNIKQKMIYAGININYKDWIGFFFSYSIGIGISAVILLLLYFPLEWYYLVGIFFFTFLILQGISELLLTLGIRSRTIFIERILPEVISLLSSNIKSGLTIDQAFILSTRDEFGDFKNDLIKASKETLTGKNLGEALKDISKNINSKLFRKTVNLIVEGINGGGELSSLLDNIAQDIREMQILKKEVSAGVVMYTIILVLASCLGAPLLFSVSLYEVETLQTLSSLTTNVNIPSTVSFLQFSPGDVDIVFLQIIVIISLSINAIFGSLMIGTLESGSAKDGVRIIPIFMAICLGVFFLAGYLVRIAFTGITV